MIKIMKKSTYEELKSSLEFSQSNEQYTQEQLASQQESYEALAEENLELHYKVDCLEDIAKEKDQEIKELQNRIDSITLSDESSVTMKIHEDYSGVTPIVRYSDDAAEKLVQTGYINMAQEDNKTAIQLALMTLVWEAMSQILESFEGDINE